MRDPDIAVVPVSYEAHEKYVVAVFYLDDSSVGVRFTSMKELLGFFDKLMQMATIVWPNDEYVKQYLTE
jgi:hypothetical protein